MRTIVDDLNPRVLEAEGVKLVLIGCGDPAMIKSYNGTSYPLSLPYYPNDLYSSQNGSSNAPSRFTSTPISVSIAPWA